MKQCYWNLAEMLYPTKYTRCYSFWCCYSNMLGSSPFFFKIKYYKKCGAFLPTAKGGREEGNPGNEVGHTTVLAQPMTSSMTKFAYKENLNTSRTKKDITKRERPFYSTLKSLLNERIFEMTYFSCHMHFKQCLSNQKLCSFAQSAPLYALTSCTDRLQLDLMATWSIWLWFWPFVSEFLCVET